MNNVMAHVYIGTEQDKDGNELEMSGGDILKWAMRVYTERFGGCTAFEAFGSFKHKDGRVVIEQAVVVSVLIGDDTQGTWVEEMAEGFRAALKQESVLVTYTPVEARFVEAA